MYLINAAYNGPHGRVSRSVHRLPVIRGSPGGAIDIYEIRLMAHTVRLDQIGHVGLIQHPDPGDHGIVRHPDSANSIIACSRDFSGASRTVALIKKYIAKIKIIFSFTFWSLREWRIRFHERFARNVGRAFVLLFNKRFCFYLMLRAIVSLSLRKVIVFPTHILI